MIELRSARQTVHQRTFGTAYGEMVRATDRPTIEEDENYMLHNTISRTSEQL